jgi:hypothetical protein
MKIKLNGCGHASEEAISGFEEFLGRQLPESVKSFLRSCDGARPEPNIFPVGPSNESGVNGFIPLRMIPQEIPRLRNVKSKAYPIAWAEGGNYVVVDADRDGGVYFWDHELVEPLTKVANDFGHFLNHLAPFDPKSIRLKPDQVKKVWIDPNFLTSLKEK